MQDDVVVRFVFMMLVFFPVRSIDMNFYISCPYGVSYFNARIMKVGAAIGIMLSGLDDLKFFVIGSKQNLIVE